MSQANESNVTHDDSNISFTKSILNLFNSKEEAEGKEADSVTPFWESITNLFNSTKQEEN